MFNVLEIYRLQEWSPRQSVEWRLMLPNARTMKPRRDKNNLMRNLETKLKDWRTQKGGMEPFELDHCGGPNQHLSLESQTGEPDNKLVLSHLCSELHGLVINCLHQSADWRYWIYLLPVFQHSISDLSGKVAELFIVHMQPPTRKGGVIYSLINLLLCSCLPRPEFALSPPSSLFTNFVEHKEYISGETFMPSQDTFTPL